MDPLTRRSLVGSGLAAAAAAIFRPARLLAAEETTEGAAIAADIMTLRGAEVMPSCEEIQAARK